MNSSSGDARGDEEVSVERQETLSLKGVDNIVDGVASLSKERRR